MRNSKGRREGFKAAKNTEMPAPIVVTDRVVVPGDALEVRAVRASGPGGQNVNKVASKVELRVDLSRIQGLMTAAAAGFFGWWPAGWTGPEG